MATERCGEKKQRLTHNNRYKKLFTALTTSYVEGLVRLSEARIGHLATLVAVAKLRSKPLPTKDGHYLWSVVEHLEEIEFKEFDSYRYVSQASFLVYGTALFDAFLSGVTRFLFFKNPSSLGADSSIPLDALLKARSRADVLNQVIAKKARDLSHQSFTERIRFLRDRFGLRINLSQDMGKALEHYASIRNTVVHEQGFYDLRLNSRNRLEGVQTRCARHPTPISTKQLEGALDTYRRAVVAIARSVFTQVLKEESIPFLELIERAATLLSGDTQLGTQTKERTTDSGGSSKRH